MYYWVIFNAVTFATMWYCKFFSQVLQNINTCLFVGLEKHGVFKRKRHISSTLLLKLMMPVFTKQMVLSSTNKTQIKNIFITNNFWQHIILTDSWQIHKEDTLIANCCLLQKPVQRAMWVTHIWGGREGRKDSSEWYWLFTYLLRYVIDGIFKPQNSF